MKRLLLCMMLVIAFASIGLVQGAVFVGSDPNIASEWRTSATFEADNEYGTDGYVIYGLNIGDGWYGGFNKSLTNPESLVSKPMYIADITTTVPNLWSGNGNFGVIQNPENNNELETTPLLAGTGDPHVFTISRSIPAGFRLTLIYADGDGALVNWSISVDDGTEASTTFKFDETAKVNFSVFDIAEGSGDITVTVSANGNFSLTGMAFDNGPDVVIVPVITSDKPSSAVDAGGTAEISIEAINSYTEDETGLTYQWYFDPNTAETGNEVALADGGDISGSTTKTLSIANAEEADEGVYMCVVTATMSGNTASSKGTLLIIKDFVYHWKLDGDGVEANGSGLDGTLEADAVFVDGGKVDGALEVDGDGDTLRVPGVEMTNSGMITISFWAKPVDIAGDWKGMLAKWEEPAGAHDTKTFWVGQHSTDGQINFSFYPGNSEQRVVSSPVLANGMWTHIVCTHDGSALRLYVNGALNATADIGAGWVERNGDLLMGYVPTGGANYFGGTIDDVRVYNYAVSDEEAAMLYIDVEGGQVCLDKSIFVVDGKSLDFNDDCKIDLKDFAMFASSWMECNLYPAAACEE